MRKSTLSDQATLSREEQLLNSAQRWHDTGLIRAIDLALPRLLWRLAKSGRATPPSAEILLLALLCSYQLGRGHDCLDLADLFERINEGPFFAAKSDGSDDPRDYLAASSLEEVKREIESYLSRAVEAPLLYEYRRLYLRRYRNAEEEVAAKIARRAGEPGLCPTLEEARLFASEFRNIFKGSPPEGESIDYQAVAGAVALRRKVMVLSGGPGTGKTTTVLRILALLQSLRTSKGEPELLIRLAAPTGKAAARLSESIQGSIAHLPEALQLLIPQRVETLHRLLGARPDGSSFRHHAGSRLPLELLVVDEASMIDIELMSALVAALPDNAQLILLGDKDQLTSVEAGSVFGDICRLAEGRAASEELADFVEALSGYSLEQVDSSSEGAMATPLSDQIVVLRHSYRFSKIGGIGQLAHSINSGDLKAARELITTGDQHLGHIVLDTESKPLLSVELKELIVEGYRQALEQIAAPPESGATKIEIDQWAAAIHQAFNRFRLLSPLRGTARGIYALNRFAEECLVEAALLQPTAVLSSRFDSWYLGRAVIVTQNDYTLGLMNGDIGIALPMPHHNASGRAPLRVAFRGENDSIVWVMPSRLGNFETVFAMTVHKSQGSEFDHTVLVLPHHDSPVLSRELLYTAVTRASDRLTLVESDPGIFATALQRRTQRHSGLSDRLEFWQRQVYPFA